ncbi:transglutaminase domain-containing protein [Candidatus Nitrosocosmicus arcticus]|uniref:Translation initiation factor 2 beta subunit n=1 Tax=Candidatus Nitrosocosmicus arcticus TaxID=2035267 RepID=A0A557SUV3_9ARCH|nr:transglutaminase domain-containing protein [Candidatus Nitrosocosmicus arcticus]TVP40378.1 translation initiation factor 2 beta subunit [Candidatus Nitrosocosmicus arcticus]
MLNLPDLTRNRLSFPLTKDILFLYKQVTKQYLDKTLLKSVNDQVPIKIRKEFDKDLKQYSDYLIPTKLLLDWFKNDFMKWMSKTPLCPTCGKPMILRFVQGNSWIVRSVEYYNCPHCNFSQNFPRYGEIENISFHRIGRCTEWSFLFGAILNSLGISTRIVHDFLDHCWNESLIDGQWIHVDSTLEYPISLNHPSYYEKNWNKQYLYVLAFSDNKVVDVTMNYTNMWTAIIERRKKLKLSTIPSIQDYYGKL